MANIGQTHQLACIRGDLSLRHEDIEATLAVVPHFNLPSVPRDTVNGVVTRHENGEFVEIWVTQSREPYRIDASYTRVL